MFPAIVAVTLHVPAPVGVKVAPSTVHDPESATYETAPAVVPPDVVKVKSAPNVAVVLVMVSAL